MKYFIMLVLLSSNCFASDIIMKRGQVTQIIQPYDGGKIKIVSCKKKLIGSKDDVVINLTPGMHHDYVTESKKGTKDKFRLVCK